LSKENLDLSIIGAKITEREFQIASMPGKTQHLALIGQDLNTVKARLRLPAQRDDA
jgi:hypothetical protein